MNKKGKCLSKKGVCLYLQFPAQQAGFCRRKSGLLTWYYCKKHNQPIHDIKDCKEMTY